MFNTPLATDQYSRVMVSAFDEKQIVGVPTAFQSFFGRPETGAKTVFSPNADVVEIDIMRANERIAALINRGGNGRSISGQKNLSTQNYTTFSRVYPLMEEESDVTADQINKRLAGENPYSAMTREDRLRALFLEHHQEQIRRMVRTFEVLSADSVLNGQMVSILGTTDDDLIYDFRRNAALTDSVSVAWDDTTPDIFGDIDGMCELLREHGKVTADMMVLGSEAIDSFIKDTDVQALADNRRFELIQVSMNNPVPSKFDKFVAGGFIPRGRLRTPAGFELWIFTYVDGYTNSGGTFTKYMPVDQALIAFSGARCDRYFGPSEILPMTSGKAQMYRENFGFNPALPPVPANIKNQGAVINPGMFYFDAYEGTNGKTITARAQAAPIFATTMTDAFGLLTDLSK